jgi:hypothetical protein
MGTWGSSLYDDDVASDLKNTIALVTKVPADGNRLLSLLTQMEVNIDPAEDDGALFWLVVADQFERRGILCERAASCALQIIESGSDLAACKARGADDKLMRERRKALFELAERLRNPRPSRAPKKAGRPPALVLEVGQIFAFPTMSGKAWHPYRLESTGEFTPDGWGALVVLATGRAFEWLPWVAVASLTVRPDTKPTFNEALNGQLIPHPQTDGAARLVPKPAHAKGLGLERLGTIDLDQERVKPNLSKWPVERAIQFDWSIAYGAVPATVVGKGFKAGVVLRELCRNDA